MSITKGLVSVVIPAYNESINIVRLLRSIKRQTYRKCETIVVDDASTDDTAVIAKQLATKVFTRRHAERSIQRNFGVTRAKGEYLFFLDADMELSKNVVKECVAYAATGSRVGGISVPEKSVARNIWEKAKAFERSFYNLAGDETTDAARFFTRTAFIEAGGYDESITGPEDWDLPETIKKRGYGIGRIQAVIYHHERIPSLLTLLRKKYYYALKTHRYLAKQNVSVVSAKTVYFLRPVFYKNWRMLARRPGLSLILFVVLSLELIAGGFGFLVGRFRKI